MKIGEILMTFPSSAFLDTSFTTQIVGDSVRVSLDIGSSIEDSIFTINLPPGYNVRVFERFRTSVVIDDEGPHWDLTSWKHYDSEWREIQNEVRGGVDVVNFKARNYTPFEWKKAPAYKKSELLEFLRSVELGDLADRLESPTKGDFIQANSSISSMYFKIVLVKPDNSQSIKYLEFEIPMGC